MAIGQETQDERDKREIRDAEDYQAQVKQDWEELRGRIAIKDLLLTIENSFESAEKASWAARDNGVTAVAACQQAYAYDTIRSYINSMLS